MKIVVSFSKNLGTLVFRISLSRVSTEYFDENRLRGIILPNWADRPGLTQTSANVWFLWVL